MTTSNNIPTGQKSPDLVKLIENTYRAAKRNQGLFVLASILLPVLSALLGKWDDAKPYFAAAGLVLLFLDVALLDRLQKDRVKRGAKLQEEFDNEHGLGAMPLVRDHFGLGTLASNRSLSSTS